MSNAIYELDGMGLMITMCSRLGNVISAEVKYGDTFYAIPKFECYNSQTKTDEAVIEQFKVLLDEIELEKQIEGGQ